MGDPAEFEQVLADVEMQSVGGLDAFDHPIPLNQVEFSGFGLHFTQPDEVQPVEVARRKQLDKGHKDFKKTMEGRDAKTTTVLGKNLANKLHFG